MRTIKLTKGYLAIVDDSDYEALSEYNWYANIKPSGAVYARLSNGVGMHCFILPKKDGFQTDHINRNSLDNRRSNLRYVTRIQNMWNQGIPKNNTSGFVGVDRIKNSPYWRSQISKIHLGMFKTKVDAAIAYDMASLMLRGEFAQTNVIKLI